MRRIETTYKDIPQRDKRYFRSINGRLPILHSSVSCAGEKVTHSRSVAQQACLPGLQPAPVNMILKNQKQIAYEEMSREIRESSPWSLGKNQGSRRDPQPAGMRTGIKHPLSANSLPDKGGCGKELTAKN